MFSQLFAGKQPDWPPQTVVSGFPFSDQGNEAGMSAELVRFLDAGPPPIVFTLGSSAVLDAGQFFEHSAAAAKLLGRRSVLIVGQDSGNRPASLPDGVIACDYVPSRSFFHEPPRLSTLVALGRRAWRCVPVVPCWSCPAPTTSSTIPRG